MGNILKIVSPVAGVKDETFNAGSLLHDDVNNPLAFSEEIAEACITALHGILVELLENKICSKSPVHPKLKEVLAAAEQQMHKQAIPFATRRHRSLEDLLDEDWLEPHCNFPDTVDFWPPPPPRTLPWRPARVSTSGFTSPCTNSSHCTNKEETETAVLSEKSLHLNDISNVDEAHPSQENVSSQLRQVSHSIDDRSVEKIPNFFNFARKPFWSRPVALIGKVSAENGRFVQCGSHICNVANANGFFICDEKKHLSEEQSVTISGDSSEAPCGCDTSQFCSTFDLNKLVVVDSNTKLEMSTMLTSSAGNGVETSSGGGNCTKTLDLNVLPRMLQPIDHTCSPLSKKIVELLNTYRFQPEKFITFSLWPLDLYSGLKGITDNWICYKRMNLHQFFSPIASCKLDISAKTFVPHWSRSLSVEPFSWACLARKIKSMHSLFHSSSLTDQGDCFLAIPFISRSQKLIGDFCYDLPFSKSPSTSSSTLEQPCFSCKFQATPISHTPVNHSAEELMVTELPSVATATPLSAPELCPTSSSRLTCPGLSTKSQLLLTLLEPVARLAASHRRSTHQALCSSEVCASTLLRTMRSPDPRVQETAAKAAANMACSASGAALLWQAGAAGALQELAGSPCFAVQLAACRALLNLRPPRPGCGLCSGPRSPCSRVAVVWDRHLPRTHHLNLNTAILNGCCAWDHRSELGSLHDLNLKTSNPNNIRTWDHHDCAFHLDSCTSTTVDSRNLFLQRVAPGHEMSNILRTSLVGPEIDLHSAPEADTEHSLPFLECCKHKLGSSNRPSHKDISISVKKPCLKSKLTCNEQSVNHTKCEMPLVQCNDNPKALCHFCSISSLGNLDGKLPDHQSMFSLGNPDSSGPMSVHECKCSSDFSGNVPVYEEGIYPILSSSDLLQLRQSFACATNDGCSAQNPNGLLGTRSPDSVTVYIPPGSSSSRNSYSTCSDLQLVEESFDNISENPPSDAGRASSSVSSIDENSENEERLPAHVRGRRAGGSVRVRPPREVDVVLLHGVLGGAAWTWRQHDDVRSSNSAAGEAGGYSWCWPRDWLAPDLLRETGTRLRLIAINGAEPWHLCDPWSLRQEGERLRGALLRAGVGRRPLLWLAHSHGGLLLKAILGDCQDEAGAAVEGSCGDVKTASLSNSSPPGSGDEGVCTALCTHTAGVVFLSTPHRGTPWAAPAALLHPSIPELADLRSDNVELSEVSRQFEACWQRRQFPVLSVVDARPLQLWPGLSVLPVPPASAAAGVGETLRVDTDHLNVCKPRSRKCGVYAAVRNFCVRAASSSRS